MPMPAHQHGIEPFANAFSVTPVDADQSIVTRGIMASVAGNINVRFEGDSANITIPVDARVVYPFVLKRINATSTTATGIIGFY